MMFLIGLLQWAVMVPPTIRRFHDLGQSGWMVLLQLVPIVSLAIGLILLVGRGTRGPNQYGDDPLHSV